MLRDNSVKNSIRKPQMAENEEQKAEETAEAEAEAPEENARTAEQSEAAPIVWSQKRVPNIEKGYNPSVPFYMMGILVALIILSVIFAKITS